MVLDVRNVVYFYKLQKKKQIVKDVSVEFAGGRFYTIAGPSGAEQTTFLLLLAGLDTAVRGNIT